MAKKKVVKLSGREDNHRIESRILEERIQDAVHKGARNLEIEAFGQHGLGGRIWISKQEPVDIKITGSPGQRVGSLGVSGTRIEVMGPASDDTGWLNAGCEVVIHGNASNGTCNAMAQGKVLVGGKVGSRAMTMTKYNPRFNAPEIWVLDSVGDYFAEFMAGGIAVICGVNPQDPENVLGYRPCVGMVGGKIFFRGPHKGFSQADAKLVPVEDEQWQWLTENLKYFLKQVGKSDLYDSLTVREEWQLIEARTPYEKVGRKRRSMRSFRREVWDGELGKGGLIGDLTDLDMSPIPLITTGELRRFVPVWENRRYAPPCQASCPTGIPVQERWRLIRAGHVDEAVDLALAYTPFPATVCGYLCPNLCMQGCTRTTLKMKPIDVISLGKSSLEANLPKLPPLSGKRVAVLGGGPGGISVAWQLRRLGHEAVIYDLEKTLGGKITSSIPESRIPKEVVESELKRMQEVLPHVHLQQPMTPKEFEQLKADFDFLVIATGTSKSINLPIPGNERMVSALDFLRKAKSGEISPGKHVVIIGAGNVGCDAATEAFRLGAEDVTIMDIKEPHAYGKEREEALKMGAKFLYPAFAKKVTETGLYLTTGEELPADTVIVSIGDKPDLSFLPENIAINQGFIVTNEIQQTTDSQVFAIGDVTRPGLLTNAIGAGRTAANAIHEIILGKRPQGDTSQMIDYSRITLEYFDPRIDIFETMSECGSECSSCGACRDCGICIQLCPEGAISKKGDEDSPDFELLVDPDKCIGCGFCAQSCPCGIWAIRENNPLA